MTDDRRLIPAPHLLDVVAGEWLEDRRILVRGDRVEAILGPGDPAPADARPMPLPGDWVLPGMIDCHSHLIGELEYAGIPAVDATPAEEAMSGVRNARTTLRAGFTTVRDVGTFWAFVDVALREAIDRGWTAGPRMQCAGAYITCPGGGGEVTGEAPTLGLPDDLRFGVVRDAAEVRDRVRALVERGADVIKCIVTGAVLTRGTDPTDVELSEEMVRAAVEEAAAHGRFVAAHAHGTEGIKTAIRAGVRSVEHGSLIDDEGIAMLRDTGTYWVADVYDGDWIAEEGRRSGWPAETMAKNEQTTQAQRDGFSKAIAAGVRLAYGTDSGVYPARAGRDPAGLPGPSRPDACRRHPLGDDHGGGIDGLGGSRRVARARAVRGPRRGRRRSSRRCRGAAATDGRAEGWRPGRLTGRPGRHPSMRVGRVCRGQGAGVRPVARPLAWPTLSATRWPDRPPGPTDRKETNPMSAQQQLFPADSLANLPASLVVLMTILAMLGVIANAAAA